MYIKIIKPKKDGRKKYNNSESCIPLINYLSKEDKDMEHKKEFYFTTSRDMVTSKEVIKTIDQNSPKISKGEARFFSLVIAPHPDEMKHLSYDQTKLKNYACEVMDIYAGTFNNKNGTNKKLKGSDLVWYGKVEYNRYYEGNDPEVKEGRAKQGDPMPGDNTHIHIIVSRQDKTQTLKLSPLVNSKKLFHREAFKLKSCEHFDRKYGYEGSGKDLERLIIMREGTAQERMAYLEKQDHKRLESIKEKYDSPVIKQQTEQKKNEQVKRASTNNGL